MSPTETLMVLALGSALTFVFFLLFGRVIWGMAVNAGARRNAKQAPVQLLDMQADRDRLRAEHAMMARKLELRVDDIKTRMAEQQAEVSRNRNRVQSMQADIESRDEKLKNKDREISALSTQLDVLKAELEATQQTVENLTVDATRRDGEMTTLQNGFRKLGDNLREKNSQVGNLNDELRQALTLESSVVPAAVAADPMAQVENRLRQRVAELTSISADMAEHQNDLNASLTQPESGEDVAPLFSARQAQLSNKVEEASRLSDQMEHELKNLDSMLANSSASANAAPAKKRGAMSNVVSLAQRLRALQ
ncbi:MAG: hypothetical protein ABJA10_10640 [Aestuariivirga sp.]